MNRARSLQEYRRRVSLAMDLINTNLHKDLSLDDVAKAADFSPFHFHRLFKGIVGEPVAEFVRRQRMVKARRLLVFRRQLSITDVALECGFSSSQAFAKAFRKQQNMSPTDYRDQHPYGPIMAGRKDGHIDSKDGNDGFWPWPYARTTNQQHMEKFDMQVSVVEQPEHYVAYIRRFGAYGPEIGATFQQLMGWAGPQGLAQSSDMIAIYWDNPELTAAEQCRSDACLIVPDSVKPTGPVATQVIPAGLYAIARFELRADQFGAAWDQLVGEWLPSSGYLPDERPCYEFYPAAENAGGDQSAFVVDLCTAVKPL